MVATGRSSGSKYTELHNCGVADVCMVDRGGLQGLPQTIGEVWRQAVTRTCIDLLLRATFRYAARQHWDAIDRAPKPNYTAPSEVAALERFLEFSEAWDGKVPGGTG
jgi:transposase-like protein